MRIFFYIHHLGNGGAERVTSVLANEMARQGHTIGIGFQNKSNNAYSINPQIELIDKTSNSSSLFRRFKKYSSLRKTIKQWKPDAIIAVMPYNFVAVKIATFGLHIPIVVSDHTNFTWNANWKLKLIRYYFYRTADVVAVLSKFDYNLMSTRLRNMVVMYNPLSFPMIKETTNKDKIVLAVGRLSAWQVKGFDRLLKIWSEVAPHYPEWKLQIAGDGDKKDYDYLKSLVESFHLNSRVEFLGFCNNIKDLMAKASIFVLTSRIEGFPCGLLEAMSQGCSPVAFSIHGIIQEIITEGEDGYIIDDDDIGMFREKLCLLIEQEQLCDSIRHKAISNIRRFDVEKVVRNWISLLESLI